MKASHPRTIGAFEVRSMVLFASLVFGGAASAQTAPQPTARSAAAPASPAPQAPPRQTAEQAAFERADSNHDGQLSAAEAQALPVIASRLRELDTDGNGSLSFEEFQRGARQ
ncbi:EF-hand domain-containing protein [Pantoea sp. 18069]|uniref:EF-hand domain-containing protein n=1 Tax=Pantoea sp. 18069 TaxID=2681415 RepID=UPI00135CD926|nr:EF-hand domain-containing protein [Pantoea sp. 18069]